MGNLHHGGLFGCLTAPHARGIDKSLAYGAKDFLCKAVTGPQGDGAYVVATAQVVEPAGRQIAFPGRPNDVALSPDESLLAVKVTRSTLRPGTGEIVFIDTASTSIVQTLTFPKGSANFCGLAWSADGRQLWTTEADGMLYQAIRGTGGAFEWGVSIALPGPNGRGNSAPGGLALDEAHARLYVALSRNNTLGVVDLASGSVEKEIPVGIAPYTVLLTDAKAYVSNWGGRQPLAGDTTGPTSGSRAVVDPDTGVASTGAVSVLDLQTGAVIKELSVGLHPCGMALSPDHSRLYVANANSDTLSVIDTARDEVVGVLGVKPLEELPSAARPMRWPWRRTEKQSMWPTAATTPWP